LCPATRIRGGLHGFAWPDAPAQQDVFVPDYAPGEIAEIAQKLRNDAGFM